MYTRRRIRLFVYVRIPSRQWYSTASFTGGTSLTSCLNISSANQSNSASLRHRILLIVTTRLHKITKVSIFKHSVTLSYLSPFPKCLHCWKAYEICCKYPPHFRHVAALSWEIKNSNVRLLRRRYRKVKDCFFEKQCVYFNLCRPQHGCSCFLITTTNQECTETHYATHYCPLCKNKM